MNQVQSPAQATATPSQVETLFVELDDEQLAVVSGGFAPVGGWEDWIASPVGGW
jgi:lactobin A/cerein 7B family class IIb bacteriocin